MVSSRRAAISAWLHIRAAPASARSRWCRAKPARSPSRSVHRADGSRRRRRSGTPGTTGSRTSAPPGRDQPPVDLIEQREHQAVLGPRRVLDRRRRPRPRCTSPDAAGGAARRGRARDRGCPRPSPTRRRRPRSRWPCGRSSPAPSCDPGSDASPRWRPSTRTDQWPACSPSSRPKTDGLSKRGKHNQSIEPSRLTSAAPCRSDRSA